MTEILPKQNNIIFPVWQDRSFVHFGVADFSLRQRSDLSDVSKGLTSLIIFICLIVFIDANLED
jgi:hypothetical protein